MSSLLEFKRKAEENPEARSSQRSPPGVSELRPVLPWKIAEDNSIYSIIHRNSQIRLYVPPISWTSDHLRCLDCSFHRQIFPSDHVILHTKREPIGLPLIKTPAIMKKRLVRPSVAENKGYTIENILEAYGISPNPSECLYFQFRHRDAAQVPTDDLYSSSAGLLNMAYITFHAIEKLRERYVQLWKRTGASLYKKRIQLKHLEPQDRHKDPYIVAVLIALAQQMRRYQMQQNSENLNAADDQHSRASSQPGEGMGQVPSKAQSFKVKVLAIPGVVSKYFYVYTTTVSADFLDKFDEPSRYSPSSRFLVSYYCIPVKEETSLEKLHLLLCPGSCPFCADKHEEISTPKTNISL
ncbi:hypothetical protein FE257_009315 [Aspergillus nanangensis]|uniref:Uncharacterized protein n=1 Tax=Aspergillus nanangensis TaxID=2582783 RepID=A0AAD4CK89_ASPNN|nr:hypothetical protein FE257_009315 [Aspergillus nanangensis]